MPNIYLDIDGVILANDANPANYADEFIRHLVTTYPTYWCTTHCRQQENYTAPLLSRFFSLETMDYIKKIIPTDWNTLKTEAIDFSAPFLWFDDELYDDEKEVLLEHGALDNWVEVDLRKNENMLATFLASFPIPI